MLAVVRSLEGIRTDQGNIGGGRDGDGAAGATKWKALLGPPGSHKMLYTLQIIEGVLESVAGYDGRGKGDLLCSSEVERGGVDRVRWATEFVRSQGFAQLCEAVLTPGLFGDEHPRSMVDVQQACLALILKVVRVFLLGVLSVPPPSPSKVTAVDKIVQDTESSAATVAVDNTDVATSSTDSASNADAASAAGSVTGQPGDEWKEVALYPDLMKCEGIYEDGPQVSPAVVSLDGGDDSTTFATPPTVTKGLPGKRPRGGDGQVRLGLEVLGNVGSKGLWESLPGDARDAVLAAAQFPALQARLMKLVGVAADVADARMQRPLCSTGAASPLNLFGCVGEGSTADAMAREALLLWVGISSAPQHCSNGRKTEVGAGGVGGGEKAGDSLCPPRTLEDLDAPVLKGIFCASDAIRLRLAKSLLSVCGVDIPEVEAEDSGAVPGDIAGIEDADVVVQEGGAENIEEVSGDGGGVAVQTD
ncbi:unnamed protein product, partial [Sphacelaria rigidula]